MSAAYDYSRAIATAQRLVARYGRVISLQGVTDGPADPDNPLAGPSAPPEPLAGIPAAFVDPSSLQSLGMTTAVAALFAQSSEIAIVAPVSGLPDFSDMKFLIEADGTVKTIDRISKLQPATEIVLYYIGVSRP